MKIKAAISSGLPKAILSEISSRIFANNVLEEVIGKILNIENVLDKPAEHYMQKPDITISGTNNIFGIEVRLTGCSRYGRTTKQFHNAIKKLHDIYAAAIKSVLPDDVSVQLFCVIMIDGEIETAPGSGEYSNVVEGEPQKISQ